MPLTAFRVKLLYWDGQGFCLYYKVLEKGRFPWPSPADGTAHLTAAQLAMLWEFKSGTLEEAEETYKLDTFGRIIGISRQALSATNHYPWSRFTLVNRIVSATLTEEWND